MLDGKAKVKVPQLESEYTVDWQQLDPIYELDGPHMIKNQR